MNLIQQLEAEQIEKLTARRAIPDFRPGDTLKVGVKVVEGERTRVQNYEGVCIARSNKGMGSSFTVRKISFGEGVERGGLCEGVTLDIAKRTCVLPRPGIFHRTGRQAIEHVSAASGRTSGPWRRSRPSPCPSRRARRR